MQCQGDAHSFFPDINGVVHLPQTIAREYQKGVFLTLPCQFISKSSDYFSQPFYFPDLTPCDFFIPEIEVGAELTTF